MSPVSSPFVSSVDDVQEVIGRGPWQTKSGGELRVLFNLPFEALEKGFWQYDEAELAKIPQDVRGLRSYKVTGVPKGSTGANEWHKLRHELVFAFEGTVRWVCEDLTGKQKTFMLDAERGVWVRPYILHSYEALASTASLLVVANTLFIPEDPTTHDTYTAESFRELQVSSPALQK
jgi:dTDP-4-dehydrorhamnose 3,5-epimerase-like enzyme